MSKELLELHLLISFTLTQINCSEDYTNFITHFFPELPFYTTVSDKKFQIQSKLRFTRTLLGDLLWVRLQVRLDFDKKLTMKMV